MPFNFQNLAKLAQLSPEEMEQKAEELAREGLPPPDPQQLKQMPIMLQQEAEKAQIAEAAQMATQQARGAAPTQDPAVLQQGGLPAPGTPPTPQPAPQLRKADQLTQVASGQQGANPFMSFGS